jgi:signal peptidase II
MKLDQTFISKKNVYLNAENIYSLIIIMGVFFYDRFTKSQVINNFSDSSLFVNNFINLDLIWNTGIGFGLLSSDSFIIYNLITLLIGIVIIILFYTAINFKKYDKFSFSMIIGGAAGNFYDRLVFNAVPDFIDFHYNTFHWFTFNVSDIFISLGIFIYLMKGLFLKIKK